MAYPRAVPTPICIRNLVKNTQKKSQSVCEKKSPSQLLNYNTYHCKDCNKIANIYNRVISGNSLFNGWTYAANTVVNPNIKVE